MLSVFSPILKSLELANQEVSEPISFLKYIKEQGLKARGTATHISVQSYQDLDPLLKEQGWMVYRLGSRAESKGTHFGLIKINGNWSQHFFFDSEIFKNANCQKLTPGWSSGTLLAFSSIPSLTETSYVNLALALNLFEKFVELEVIEQSIPATGRGNYSFSVQPSNLKPEIKWQHQSGQVEIDSVFVANYLGQKHLVIVEAKTSKRFDSLAKYKLAYPALAIRETSDLPILPVYLRIIESSKSLDFFVGICKPVKKTEPLFIDNLQIELSKKISCLR